MEYNTKKYGNPYTQFNYTLNKNGSLVKYGNNPKTTVQMFILALPLISSNVLPKMANRFSFIWLPSTFTAPYTPAPRYANLFPDAQAPRVPNFNEANVSTKPQYIQNLPQLNQRQIDVVDKNYRKRLQSLQSVDDAISKLVDTLKANGHLTILTSFSPPITVINRVFTGQAQVNKLPTRKIFA